MEVIGQLGQNWYHAQSESKSVAISPDGNTVALTANTNFISSLAVSASTIGNIGPGLGVIGPMYNWEHFPNITKIIISFCMLLGRLEIFTIMILYSRTYWRRGII